MKKGLAIAITIALLTLLNSGIPKKDGLRHYCQFLNHFWMQSWLSIGLVFEDLFHFF